MPEMGDVRLGLVYWQSLQQYSVLCMKSFHVQVKDRPTAQFHRAACLSKHKTNVLTRKKVTSQNACKPLGFLLIFAQQKIVNTLIVCLSSFYEIVPWVKFTS